MAQRKMKVLIFGAGETAERCCDLYDSTEIVGVLDNDTNKHGLFVRNHKILGGIEQVNNYEYDKIIICSYMSFKDIKDDLIRHGVPNYKCEVAPEVLISIGARVNFLQNYSGSISKNMIGAVAEGGVFRGDFAAEINRLFPKKSLFLFDTFEGFDNRDCEIEASNGYSTSKTHMLEMTGVEIVMEKLPYPQNVTIRKGYFPETTKGLEDIYFSFVNLDFDLYQPTIEGLTFFYPRMESRAVILIHDYFCEDYAGVKQAVSDYEERIKTRLTKIPIGDGCSLAIIKEGI